MLKPFCSSSGTICARNSLHSLLDSFLSFEPDTEPYCLPGRRSRPGAPRTHPAHVHAPACRAASSTISIFSTYAATQTTLLHIHLLRSQVRSSSSTTLLSRNRNTLTPRSRQQRCRRSTTPAVLISHSLPALAALVAEASRLASLPTAMVLAVIRPTSREYPIR